MRFARRRLRRGLYTGTMPKARSRKTITARSDGSYSQRGADYALDETAHGWNGLWSFQSVWFSRWGTLLDTAEAYVDNAAAVSFVE